MAHQLRVKRFVIDTLSAFCQSTRKTPAVPEHLVATLKQLLNFFECLLSAIGYTIADEVQGQKLKTPLPDFQCLGRIKLPHAL